MEVERPVRAVTRKAEEVDEQAAEEYWRPAFAILLEEGRRDIDNQLRELSELRGRAAALIGYAGLALSIVLAVHPEPAMGPAILAGVALACVVGCAFWIQLPARLSVELGGTDLAKEIRDAGTPSAAMEIVGGFHVQNYNDNKNRLQPLQWAYFTGVAAFAVEVVALVLVVL
jgi:hypothetical protein